jgi:hypothetical protein
MNNIKYVIYLVAGILFITLIMKNPSEIDHKSAVKNEIIKLLQNESDDSRFLINTLGDYLLDSIVAETIDKQVYSKNLYIISFTRFKSSTHDIGKGIAGNISLYDDLDASSQLKILAKKVLQVCSDFRSSKEFIIGKTILIDNLIIASNDFQEKMSLAEGVRYCEELGSGWRLPTIDEFELLYFNREKIGGFSKDLYWSSSFDFDPILGEESYYFSFYTGGRGLYYNMNKKYSIRAVKDNF